MDPRVKPRMTILNVVFVWFLVIPAGLKRESIKKVCSSDINYSFAKFLQV